MKKGGGDPCGRPRPFRLPAKGRPQGSTHPPHTTRVPTEFKESKKLTTHSSSGRSCQHILVLRGTTHIDPEQRSFIWAVAHSRCNPGILLVCLLTVASGAVYFPSTASSGANFSRLFREKACSRWPFLSIASRSAYFSHRRFYDVPTFCTHSMPDFGLAV